MLCCFSLLLAGCLQAPDQADDPPASTGGDDDSDAEPGATGQATATEEKPTDEASDEDDKDQADADGNATNGTACHEQKPPQAAHPTEQRVESRSEIRCTSHYMVVSDGSGNAWQTPTWEVDDWWVYEERTVTGGCAQHELRVVDDNQTHLEVPVYTVDKQGYSTCGGQPHGDPEELNYTRSSLQKIFDNGQVVHELLFPLREGMQWIWAGSCRDECVIIEAKEVRHEPSFVFGGGTEEAWFVRWTVETDSTTVHVKTWWSPEHENFLRKEMCTDEACWLETNLLASSHGNPGGLDDPL